MNEVVRRDGAPSRETGSPDGRRRAAGAVTDGIHVAMRELSTQLNAMEIKGEFGLLEIVAHGALTNHRDLVGAEATHASVCTN